MLPGASFTPGLKPVPARTMPAKFVHREKSFAPSAPRCTFGAIPAQLHAAALVPVVAIAAQVRESDIVQRPEKLDTDALPRLFMLDAQLTRGLDFTRALKANILAVLSQEVEQNQLTQAVAGRPVGHAQKGTLASTALRTCFIH